MDKKEGSSTNFMPDDLLEFICILERGKKHISYKIIRKGNYFSLITISRQEWRIDAIEELRFRSRNSNSSGSERIFFRRQATKQKAKA